MTSAAGDPADVALGDLGRAEAARSAAFLATALPPDLRATFDEAFIRSHVLYREFVCRLVLRIARDMGLDAALATPGTSREVARRASLDGPHALVPLDWMLRYLAARGWLETHGGDEPRFRATRPLPSLDPAPVREEQRAWVPSWMPAYALAEAVARDYPAFLRGQATGEEVLFAPRRLRLWVDYFSNDHGLYTVNNQVGAVAATEWWPDAPGAILELGGGLGSGALALLARLDATGRLGAVGAYHFTELVPAFLRRGEQALRARYPTLAGLRYGALDMDRPFGEQGVAPGSAALVFAVNTLHAARDLAFTLGEVRRTLVPGGRLVISECVPPLEPIYAEFVFNLTETFRSPRLDPRVRPHGGFLEPEHWRAALEGAGLVDVRVLPDLARIRAEVPDFGVAAIGAARPAGR